MHSILNLSLAFLEGLGLILSPCILPVLPILLSGSLTGSRRRPFGIITGFILTFALFTFFSRLLVSALGINLTILRYASYFLLFLFGAVMLSDSLANRFSQLTSWFATLGSRWSSHTTQDGFGSGLILGSLVGLVWTPCAGPILAAAIVQAALQDTNLEGFLVVLFFGIGAGLPMLAIALFGRGLMNRLGFLKQHSAIIRKGLGVIILLAVTYLTLNEANLLTGTDPSSSEKKTETQQGPQAPRFKLEKALETSYPAPEFAGIEAWINSPALTMASLKGKVVLVDFWTYSCVNCIRTLPYIKSWYAQYHEQGFEIVGVHTPEFEFEKDLKNVEMAVKKFGILYPVALDPKYQTWNHFKNRYWPAHFLIDKTGQVVYEHFGEGDYDVTENNIRYLLNLSGPSAKTQVEQVSHKTHLSPETYLGHYRAEAFANPERAKGELANYKFPKVLEMDHWALEGAWLLQEEHVLAKARGAKLKLHFEAKKVFLVMGNRTGKALRARVTLNGESVGEDKGADVQNSFVEVKEHRLYELLSRRDSSPAYLQLEAQEPGIEFYVFTFGR